MLTLNEAAKFTGLKRSTLREWVYERKLPAIKIGGTLRFQLSHLELLIDAFKRASLSSLPKRSSPVDSSLTNSLESEPDGENQAAA